jgi:threonine/homoserine/homoserine lactone efflux protein
MMRIFVSGLALGLGAAVPIGPVNVEIARRTLRRGFRAGFAIGCGAVSVDVTYAIVSSLTLRSVVGRPMLLNGLTMGGGLLLTYLGVQCLRAAWQHAHADPLAGATDTAGDALAFGSPAWAYATGVLMTFLNPMTLLFWFVAVPATVGAITQQPRRDLPMICAGVFIGTLAWVICFAGMLAWIGRFRRKWWLAVADGVGGAMLLTFAAAGFWRLGHLPL